MGLFDKKNCDICGEKIGLLGNRKLEDGNCCKECAKKLSPFFSERRKTTVEQIKQQLAYRLENQERLAEINPDLTVGYGMKVMIDTAAHKFIVTRANDWYSANPDIIDISQVKACDIVENEYKTERMRTDRDGKRVSFNPPQYDFSYAFNVKLLVDSPWFDEINFELSEGHRPNSRMSFAYKDMMKMSDDLRTALSAPAPAAFASYQVPQDSALWNCPACGAEAQKGKFCEYCGTSRP